MRKAIDRSFLTRLFLTTALSLALITASAAGVRAEIVIVQGDDGVNGADGVNPGDPGLPGGDGESVTANAGRAPFPLNKATAYGGDGGAGGNGSYGSYGGNGGNGGARRGDAISPAEANAAAYGGVAAAVVGIALALAPLAQEALAGELRRKVLRRIRTPAQSSARRPQQAEEGV